MIARLLAEGDGGPYGIHTEMFTNGLMQLHEAGKVDNTKKALYSRPFRRDLRRRHPRSYDWLADNDDIAFMPVEAVNTPELMARHESMVTINGAIAVDIQGQVVADTVAGNQYSGVGGHEDFVSGPSLSLRGASLLCLPSTAKVGGEVVSRIVPWFPPAP